MCISQFGYACDVLIHNRCLDPVEFVRLIGFQNFLAYFTKLLRAWPCDFLLFCLEVCTACLECVVRFYSQPGSDFVEVASGVATHENFIFSECYAQACFFIVVCGTSSVVGLTAPRATAFGSYVVKDGDDIILCL